MNDSEITNAIKSLLNDFKNNCQNLEIIIVANVKGITETDDYERHSVITDFFNEEELEEIITAFRDFGLFVEVFTDEKTFIEKAANGRLNPIPGRKKLIYNTSQKGTGAARHSLVPAFCKLYNLPYIGSNGYVSSLARHKYHFNSLLSKFHANLPKSWLYLTEKRWLFDIKPTQDLKVIAKPIYEAASIGISSESVFFYNSEMDERLKEYTKIYKQPISVEQFIEGYEVEVPILFVNDYQSLGPVGIELDGRKNLEEKILSYDNVYNDGYSFYTFQELDNEITSRVLKCASISAQVLEMEDYGRIDFRITKDGGIYLTDITTGPHMVKHSAFNHIFNTMGFSHSELLATIAAISNKRYP